ncbi:peroxiredoxin [Balneola vulgaris]|uniref:peroxiredoxin n=1 Tax=Balneola vulgaris TaxID=287535 RepID=UPI00037CDF20|nr:peroxiredoxin [Balneola vulgaris]
MKISVGDKAPDFTLKNTNGEDVTLSGYFGKKNVVLLFFPLAFTGTCTEELCTTRDNLKIYNSLNAEVLGISVDSFFSLKQFKEAQNLNFQLLSDFNKIASESYGVLYKDFFGMFGVSKRSAFVIDQDGVVQYAEVLENASELPDFKGIQDSLL